MPRRSQTDLAVLGALSTGPMTGYEVRRLIAGTLGHFWSESFGQIYPTLTRLERGGLVRRSGTGRTSGSALEITTAGTARLRELLAEPHVTTPPRNGLLLRLFFGSHLSSDEVESLLHQARDRAREALAGYETVRDDIAGDDSHEQAYRTMTLSFGEHAARAQLAWAEESLAALPAIREGSSRARG
ncbi:MAG: PadR family transcriptional regulator [Phycicoccus sp.]